MSLDSGYIKQICESVCGGAAGAYTSWAMSPKEPNTLLACAFENDSFEYKAAKCSTSKTSVGETFGASVGAAAGNGATVGRFFAWVVTIAQWATIGTSYSKDTSFERDTFVKMEGCDKIRFGGMIGLLAATGSMVVTVTCGAAMALFFGVILGSPALLCGKFDEYKDWIVGCFAFGAQAGYVPAFITGLGLQLARMGVHVGKGAFVAGCGVVGAAIGVMWGAVKSFSHAASGTYSN